MFVDEEKWGRTRLFSLKQWPGLKARERQIAADQTVDLFHKKVKALELDIQWRSGIADLKVHGETSEAELDLPLLERLLEDAYQEVAAGFT
jgi:hypothetical protein